jgi:threonylcarbamoyladenosine tRNA methylthiotransferase MtaB
MFRLQWNPVAATFQLISFGCRASQADGAALRKLLLEAGLNEAEGPEACDVAVLNTCTVTARADAEVRQVVRRIHRANPQCQILVTGCYAQRAPEELAQLEGVTWVVGNSHKHKIVELLGLPARSPEPADTNGQAGAESRSLGAPGRHPAVSPLIAVGEISNDFHFAPVLADDRTRPTLKVQDGCDARCSFCIIPAVRGRSRSLPPHIVIEEVRRLERQGYKEIVLSGINLGGYGRDLNRSITFLGLLERILAETALPRLRISSIEPMDVSPALIRLAATEPRLAQHFHIPLQSGSDRLLRAMHRRYWTSQYAERLLAIRQAMPHAALGADVMVGFPGETEHDHQTSARFIDSLPFTYLHVFPFSPRPGTPAAALANPVSSHAAQERSRELRRLAAQKHQNFLESQIGRTLSVLTLESTSSEGRSALSTNYLKISLPASAAPPNTLLDVHVARAHEGILYGDPAETRAT